MAFIHSARQHRFRRDRFRALRNALKMSQDALAFALGVTKPTISRWENHTRPRGDLIPKIIEYFAERARSGCHRLKDHISQGTEYITGQFAEEVAVQEYLWPSVDDKAPTTGAAGGRLVHRPDEFDAIQRALAGEIRLSGPYYQQPTLRSVGKYTPSERALTRSHPQNEPHAFVQELQLDKEPPHIDFSVSDYSVLCAEQEVKNPLRALYAGAILVCEHTHSIYVHKRSEEVRFMPGYFHTLSGNFIPIRTSQHNRQDDSLHDTCVSEILEEAHVTIDLEPSESIPIVISEQGIGFYEEGCGDIRRYEQPSVTAMWLGVPISRRQAGRIKSNWEGKVIPVRLDKLKDYVKRKNWVTSGIAHVLAWLCLGAPNAPQPFAEQSEKVAKAIMVDLLRSKSGSDSRKVSIR